MLELDKFTEITVQDLRSKSLELISAKYLETIEESRS